MKKITIIFVLFGLMLAACSPKSTIPTSPAEGGYPSGQNAAAPTEQNAYPSGSEPLQAQFLGSQSGDDKLTKGEVFLQSAEVVAPTGTATDFSLIIKGNLPTPCNQLRGEMAAPDASNKIVITLYSLVSTDQVCAQVLQPFTTSTPLGSLAKGTYTVEINGTQMATVTVP